MFIFTKTSDTGSSHPINARIAIGLAEILKLTKLTLEQKATITFILSELSQDLIRAEKSALKVMQEIEDIEASILLQASNKTPSDFRSALSLDDVMIFIKYSKSGLRRVAQIIDLTTTNNNIIDAYFDNILKNLKKHNAKFKDVLDEYEKILEAHKDWYPLLIDLRNDDEHRNPTDDFLRNYHILNYYLERPQLIPRGNKKPILVYAFLRKSVACALPFCEDLILLFLSIHLPDIPLELIEIPLSERNPQCPKRFKIIPTGMK